MLAEASRVLAPGGELFVYTHVRKNAPIAAGLRWINGSDGRLERWGLIDARQERLRKSDHLNPLRDIPELEQVVSAAGFRIQPNSLLHADRRRVRREHHDADGGASDGAARGAPACAPRLAPTRRTRRRSAKHARRRKRASPAARRRTLRCECCQFVMKLDLLLFGRIRSGPFFALLVKE